VFDKCALDNLNIERPYFGYFSEVKVHHTERPRPPGIMKPSDFPDRPDALPDDEPRPPAKFGNRKAFFN
jgi:NADH dehydrogenase (ubiquinone) 1 alpha subcomplex subunit 8